MPTPLDSTDVQLDDLPAVVEAPVVGNIS